MGLKTVLAATWILVISIDVRAAELADVGQPATISTVAFRPSAQRDTQSRREFAVQDNTPISRVDYDFLGTYWTNMACARAADQAGYRYYKASSRSVCWSEPAGRWESCWYHIGSESRDAVDCYGEP